jgi:hypothetical protein
LGVVVDALALAVVAVSELPEADRVGPLVLVWTVFAGGGVEVLSWWFSAERWRLRGVSAYR